MVGDPGITFRQLEQLIAVADTGGFAAAAQSLHLTPNAVAQSVTELERILGVPVTVRQRARGVTLTPTGARFVERARALLYDAADLVSESSEDRDTPLRGRITLGCFAPLAPTVIAQVWSDLAREHPGVELRIVEADTTELVQDVLTSRVDAIITYAVNLPPELHTVELFGARLKVSLAGDHPLAGQDSVALEDLADEPLVLLDKAPSGENTLNILRRRGITPRIVHRTEDFELMRSLVGRGAGYGMHFLGVGTELSREGLPVVCRPVSPGNERESVVLGWPRGVTVPRRVRAVADLARASAEGSAIFR
ncbi:LysR substrate-binding domain-containing protein [Kocuria marina]|uniref:LysR substrate-binding domain-containing protein n=1 Tax=Kocuria marina TaxID=223184 RepID=UPI0022E31C75|nr:LysR substrate-binding domain-containing protein [Kocuria marina]